MNQMKWHSPTGDGEKKLYISTGLNQWQIYSSSPLAVPDYQIPGGSKGFATYQKLLKLGWELVSSNKKSEEI